MSGDLFQMMKPVCLLLMSGLLCSCQYVNRGSGQLKTILRDKQLVVVTRNAPTTYYELHDEKTGPEYELTQAFAAYLGVKVRYVVKDTVSEVLASLQDGEADLAAAGLTRTTNRGKRFLFGPVYQHVEQQLVCRNGGKNPHSLDDLAGVSLRVASATSYIERLKTLQMTHPDIQWQSIDDDTENLLEDVWQKKFDCTVADSNIVAINRRYFPDLRVQFNLTKPQSLSWLLPKRATALQQALKTWMVEFKKKGGLKAVMERYYGFINEFDYIDAKRFKQSIKTVLPIYRKDFQEAASKYDLDWTLLAAQAYQESHWRPKAVSPTGVRGIMMLTLDTARELGVRSRLNPRQSIFGGARYFKSLYDRIPDDVNNPDRKWFTLAAYNIGLGHLEDARILAQRLGKNPDHWSDISEVFPLLSKRKYYKTLIHGYARGREPVSYVQHIRDYHDILYQTIKLAKNIRLSRSNDDQCSALRWIETPAQCDRP